MIQIPNKVEDKTKKTTIKSAAKRFSDENEEQKQKLTAEKEWGRRRTLSPD